MLKPSPRPAPVVADAAGLTVVGAGLLLIALQLTFRGWASFRGWFYWDDFIFLSDATGHAPTLSYLLAPHDSQFMPGGVLCAWFVAHAGAYNWAVAAGILLGFQALADVAALWMLTSLFGRRWATLALLSVYLFSTLTLTAFMWWSAGINQVPVQAACFTAVALHVRYLRTGKKRYAVLAAATIGVGLCFYVKAILILIPVLALTFVWFRERTGGRWRTLRKHLWVTLGYGALALAYVVYYSVHVPNPLSAQNVAYFDVADAMFRRSLGPALVGGPWSWSFENPPGGRVATPMWLATAVWIVLALIAVVLVVRRRADWRALLLAVPYLVLSYLLAARGRGQLGAVVGLELRYLADSVPVLVLALGLFLLPVVDAGQPDREAEPSASPAHAAAVAGGRKRLRTTLAVFAGAAVVTGAVVSNVSYARAWGDDFAGRRFASNVLDATRTGPLHVLDSPVPTTVLSGVNYPYNLPSRFFRPLGGRVVASTSGTDLYLLDGGGNPRVPVMGRGLESAPGPTPGCGYPVTSEPTNIPLTGSLRGYFWTMRLAYITGSDGSLEVSIGGTDTTLPAEAGAHAVFLQGGGPIQDLRMRTTTSDEVVCVDQVTFGEPEPLS